MKNSTVLKNTCEISSLLSAVIFVFTGAVCFFEYCAFSFYYFFIFTFKNKIPSRVSNGFTAIA